jgi:alkylhydroperoxidase family enzyme
VPYHAGAARFEGADDDLVASVQQFDERAEEVPDSLRTIIDVGLKSVYSPGEITDDDVDAVRRLGYTDAELVELVVCAQVSFKNAALNLVLNLGQ